MKKWLAILLLVSLVSYAQEMPFLYGKNYETPTSPDDVALVSHVKESLKKALAYESKLNLSQFAEDQELKIWHRDTPSDHLLNNLCNLPGSSHLHVGLLKGGSFVAALYGNQHLLRAQIGVDWFQEYPRALFEANSLPYLNLQRCQIIDSGCFDLDKSLITTPIEIYFYDADHTMKGHEAAFTYYDEVFGEVFIAVVDDWRCPWVRRPTFKAFEKLGYRILFEDIIPATAEYGHGQYVAVIKKSILPK